MNFRAFLRDRRIYVVSYVVATLLIAVAFQFDLWLIGSEARWGTVVYALVFGLLGLVLFLGTEYRRQAAFFRQLAQPIDVATLDKISVLNSPSTLEQQLYSDAWGGLYAVLRDELAKERHRGEQRVHLLSQWAHHMKTPVSVIDLELQKARQLTADPQFEALIDSIDEENQRLGDSLQILLNVIRLDDFASDFRVEHIDLIPLVRQAVNDHRRAFIAHRVYPKIVKPPPDVPPSLLCVASDGKWLRLILDQILSNAIKYTARPDREGQVHIRVVLAEGQTILEVVDNGIGIPPEDLGRVFNPFFTGATGRAHARSTGMGLYLAREACHRLGHRLTLQSQVGEGTQVRIHFSRDPSIFAELKETMTAR